MGLTKNALNAINDQRIRLLLALALNCGELTVRRYIKSNDRSLTEAASMEVIRKETGMMDSEILEKKKVFGRLRTQK